MCNITYDISILQHNVIYNIYNITYDAARAAPLVGPVSLIAPSYFAAGQVSLIAPSYFAAGQVSCASPSCASAAPQSTPVAPVLHRGCGCSLSQPPPRVLDTLPRGGPQGSPRGGPRYPRPLYSMLHHTTHVQSTHAAHTAGRGAA